MLDLSTPSQQQTRTTPSITETVTATQLPSESVGYLAKPTEAWDWHDVRDYVVRQIEVRRGLQPRNSKKEYGIFHRFCDTYGDLAGLVARYSFEVCDGYWAGAPISVNRFCKASDDFFGIVILERIADSGWTPTS